MNRFRIDQPFLSQMLNGIGDGKIQLPDFQRGWIWDDNRIQSLIASVSQEFPIGSVLTLDATGTNIRFKPRPIEGVNSNHSNTEPETFILDGQQRLTALYQALMSDTAVSTKNTHGRPIRRHYFLDMKACVDNDVEREQAIIPSGEDYIYEIQTPEGNTQTIDLSSCEVQYEYNLFPVHNIFDDADWRQGYNNRWRDFKDQIDLLFKFEVEIIQPFSRYSIPVIELKEVPREAVCKVFEKVNTGGVTLTVFELLTASLAAEDFELRKDWNNREERLKKHAVLNKIENVNFLQILTLLYTKNCKNVISCKRDAILGLSRRDYEEYADQAEEGLERAVRFLHEQKIFNSQDLPYNGQLVPLAAILADLNNSEINKLDVRKKLTQWYWCGVFGELYGASTDTRFANDLNQVSNWIRGDENRPRTIREANFHENRLLELRTRTSAPYKGISALLMHNPRYRDFCSGTPIEMRTFFEDNIDIHHIFPKFWCENQNIDRDVYNNIINKTALSSRTNKFLGKKSPSQYLQKIQSETGIDTLQMDEILNSHLICAEFLREDNFEEFFITRKEAILNAIEIVMDKKVNREAKDLADTIG